MAGFLYKPAWNLSGFGGVADITPKAHDFLANIRNDTIWNKSKVIAGEVGVKSLSAFAKIASSVVGEIIKSHLLTG